MWRKRSRSSAMSIESIDVPRMFTPFSSQTFGLLTEFCLRQNSLPILIANKCTREFSTENSLASVSLRLNLKHILCSNRLKVQFIRSIIVSRNRLRVTVYDDCLVAYFRNELLLAILSCEFLLAKTRLARCEAACDSNSIP